MNLTPRVTASYIIVCLVWGTTWLFIKLGLNDLTPFFSAGLRFAVASLVFGIVIAVKKYPVHNDKNARLLYLYNALFSFIIPFGLVYWGGQFIASGLSAIMFAVYPFFVALVSRFALQGDKFKGKDIVGMILSFSGIVVIFINDIQVSSIWQVAGMSAILISAAMQSTVVIAIKKYGSHLHPVSQNLVPMILGAVVMLLAGLFTEGLAGNHLTLNSVTSVLYLGIFGTFLTFSLYYWLLHKIPLVMLSVIAFITPVVAILAGMFVNGELLSTNQIAGSVLVLSGLILPQIIRDKSVLQ